MTLNVYASLFEDDLDDVADRLDAALAAALAPSDSPSGTVSMPAWWSRSSQVGADQC